MKPSGCLWNGLTVIVLALTALACVWISAVFVNPLGAYNPFQLPLNVEAATATPTAFGGTPTETIVFPTLPPEWTATFTPQPFTGTPTVTRTVRPSATPVFSPVGPTPTESETPQPTRTPTGTAAPRQPTLTPGSYPATSVLPPSATPGGGYP